MSSLRSSEYSFAQNADRGTEVICRARRLRVTYKMYTPEGIELVLEDGSVWRWSSREFEINPIMVADNFHNKSEGF